MLTGLRSVAFLAFMVLVTLLVGFFGAPALFMGRNAATTVAKFWTRTILFGLKYVAGVSHRIEGEEFMPQSGALIAANHQSMWETIALYAILPNPVMILKQELVRIPVYGWWAKPTGSIIVDREGGAKTLRKMQADARDKIKAGDQVIVFPEGTRIAPGMTTKFHPGVAGIYNAADTTCTPVAHDSGVFWRHPGITKIPGEITLRFLPSIEKGLERRQFMTTLKSAIEDARPDLKPNALEPS